MYSIKYGNNKGFSLIELMIAIVIISIALIPMLNMFDMGASTQKRGELELEALNVAQGEMERLIADFYNGSSISSSNKTVNAFNVVTTVNDSGTNLKQINVLVNYNFNGNNKTVSLTTKVVRYE